MPHPEQACPSRILAGERVEGLPFRRLTKDSFVIQLTPVVVKTYEFFGCIAKERDRHVTDVAPQLV